MCSTRARRWRARSPRRAIAKLVGEQSPDAVLFVQSYDGRDAMGRLSVKLDRPVLTNGFTLAADGELQFGTTIFGGTQLVDAQYTDDGVALIGVRPKSFTAEPSGGGAASVVSADSGDAGRAAEATVLEVFEEEQTGPKLEEAQVVVSGGRGIGAAENYKPLVEELAKALKGAFGRVACDRRRRVGAVRVAGGPDRQDREAEGVRGARDLGCDPAHGRHEELATTSSPSTRTPRPRSSALPTSASWATCTRSCRR